MSGALPVADKATQTMCTRRCHASEQPPKAALSESQWQRSARCEHILLGEASAGHRNRNRGRENIMKVGTVTGSIWATRKAQCLQGQTFLVVESGGEEIVAADQVGAGPGDRVLLATGTVASRFCMDAAVVAVVDGEKER